MEALTVAENNELVRLEGIIRSGLKSFYEVGNALMQIRDDRLYKSSHNKFEDYCKEKWGMTRRHANQLIGSVKVMDALGTTVPTPTNERQLRPLSVLEPEAQADAWQEAVDTAPNGKVTAKHVESVVRKLVPRGTPVSDAMAFATMAISQLERIQKDDPERGAAGEKVITWIETNLLEEV